MISNNWFVNPSGNARVIYSKLFIASFADGN